MTLSALGLSACTYAPTGFDHSGAPCATVLVVQGDVQFTMPGQAPQKLRRKLTLAPGTTISTGPDSTADLWVNGHNSTVRVKPATVVTFSKMNAAGQQRDADSQTELRLVQGCIVGSVRKISANSKYEIIAPDGTASIRGTDFKITTSTDATGKSKSIFVSVTGQVVVTAEVGPNLITKVLNTGEKWTPGDARVTKATVEEMGLVVVVLFPRPPDRPEPQPPPPPMIQPFNGHGPPNPATAMRGFPTATPHH